MSWQKACDAVIGAGERATARPWRHNGEGPGYIVEDQSGEAIRCDECPPEETMPEDFAYITTAANNSVRLAKMVRVLASTLVAKIEDTAYSDEWEANAWKFVDKLWAESGGEGEK